MEALTLLLACINITFIFMFMLIVITPLLSLIAREIFTLTYRLSRHGKVKTRMG